jgi:hypothetical protein
VVGCGGIWGSEKIIIICWLAEETLDSEGLCFMELDI